MNSQAQGEDQVEEKISQAIGVPTLTAITSTSSVKESAPKVETTQTIKEVNITQPEPKLEAPVSRKLDVPAKYLILESLFRTPLTLRPEFEISTYVPDSALMYYKINIMDKLMIDNEYFRRQNQSWHPFLSRLYFGILFYIQTLRAQQACGRISENQKTFLKDFLEIYPANSLNIPGPLALTFKSLSSSKSEIGLSGLVTPAIPDLLGPNSLSQLIGRDSIHLLQLPHIPGLLGFCKTLTSAEDEDLPDYTDITTFDNSANRIILNHTFQANNWTLAEREFLMNPALTYIPATDEDCDYNFRDQSLYIKNIEMYPDALDYRTIRDFLCMSDTMEWFEPLLQIMSEYCCYFNAKTNLNNISPHGLQTSLIYSLRNVNDPITNNSHLNRQMTHAFNEKSCFTFTAQHFTPEPSIPDAVSLIACSSQTNVKYALPASTDDFSTLCLRDPFRIGPYWNRRPVWNQTVIESNYLKTRDIITKSFFIEKP